MELNTSAAVIAFISRIEEDSARLYEQWADRDESLKSVFLDFAKDNRKHEKNIKRAYYSVVTDALETNFCFKGLSSDFAVPEAGEAATGADMVRTGLKLEQDIKDFYARAADMSRSLLADVPRAMDRVVKAREARLAKLAALTAA